jgi:hypothetical protein
VRAEILCRRPFVAFAHRHVDHPVQTERDTRAAVAAMSAPRIGDEQIAHVNERLAVEAGAG